jgi:hypothetical protein
VLFVTSAARGQRVVIDFEDLACGPSQYGTNVFPGPYISNGFMFSSNYVWWANFCSNGAGYLGSTTLINYLDSGVNTLTKVGGGAFSLFSIGLAQLYSGQPGQTITFTGTLPNSSQVFQSFLLAPSTLVLTQYVFNRSFANVVSVSWSQLGPYHQFDNVTANLTAVPEPVTVALLATGLLGVGAAQLLRRRRRP